MDESMLVGRALSGDLDAFGRLYDSSFQAVYDFAWRSLRDVDEAAGATRETFLHAAAEASTLGRAPSFRAWLFRTAHAAVIGRAERVTDSAPEYDEAFGAFDVPDSTRLADPALLGADTELPALVWQGIASLGVRDYAALHLRVREGFQPAEVGWVLGVGKREAKTISDRIEPAANDVIRSYVVARRGGTGCEQLQHILGALTFPPYSGDVRRGVEEHVSACETCRQTKAAVPHPLTFLASFTAAAAPLSLKADVWRDASPAWSSGLSAAGAPPPPPVQQRSATQGATLPPIPVSRGGGGSGLPPVYPPGTGDDAFRSRALLFGGAAAALLLFAFGGAALFAGGFGDGGSGNRRSTSTPVGAGVSTPATTLTPRVVVETPTAGPATETPPPTETPLPSETPSPEPPTLTPAPTDTRTPEPPAATPTRTPRGFRPSETPDPDATAESN